MFAQSVYIGDLKWDLEQASAILVTLSEELNIIVPAYDANPAVYIDVPLDSISEVYYDKMLDADPRQPSFGLVLRLMGGTATNCVLNATGYAEGHVALAFASEKDASTLRKLLTPANAWTDGALLHYHSEAIDVSEPILSDDELAPSRHDLSNGQIPTRRASLAGALIPQGNAAKTINPSMLERIPTSPQASVEHQGWSSNSAVELDESLQRVGHNLDMAAEGVHAAHNSHLVEQAIEGIDVSQPDCLGHEDVQDRDSQALVPYNALSKTRGYGPRALGDGMREPTEQCDRDLDNRPSSSFAKDIGLNAADNVPESRAQIVQKTVSFVKRVGKDNSPETQNGEHDDLYDASPKIKDGHPISPGTIVIDNAPQNLEWPPESTTRPRDVKTGPPVKLRRQLRNADGIAESHTEQTEDAVFPTSTEKSTTNVKTITYSNKKRATVPAKAKKESTKPTKKPTQSKGKAIAAEGPPNASFDNHDLPPSTLCADSTVQLSVNKKKSPPTAVMATRTLPNNQKQAKRPPVKAVATTSFKVPAPQLTNGSKHKANSNSSFQESGSHKIGGKINDNDDDDDDDIWDVGKAQSEQEPQSPRHSRQPAKTAKKQERSAPKTKKAKAQTPLHAKVKKPKKAQAQASIGVLAKAKPAPVPLSHTRPRRTAAIKANKKIQGLEESDEIVDDEETVTAFPQSSRPACSDAAEMPKNKKVENGGDGQSMSREKSLTARYSLKDQIPDSVSPESSDEQRPDSVSELRSDSKSEKVDLIRDVPAKALRATSEDTRDTLQKGKSTSAAETLKISLSLKNGDSPNRPNTSTVQNGVEGSEDRIKSAPDHAQIVYESNVVTEPASTRSHKDKFDRLGLDDLDATYPATPGGQDQVEPVLLEADLMSFEIISKLDRVEEEIVPPQALPTQMAVENKQGRASPPSAEVDPKRLPVSTAKRRDPFGAKLNASIPGPMHINARVKSSIVSVNPNPESEGPNTPKLTELASSSRESKARTTDNPGTTSFEEAKQVKSSRWHLNSALQVDGSGRDPLMQTSNPTEDSVRASGVETKRRIEQLGDISHKRLKLADREQLEGTSATKKAGYNTTKTPLPPVIKKPRMIGFSSSGPRNQGIISTKKRKSAKTIGFGAPGADLPDPTANQVGAPSRQELPEAPSEYNRLDLKNTGAAQKKARGSPYQKQAEHLKPAEAVAIREANTQDHRATKRKIAPFLDDPAPWEHEKTSKRQRRDKETPPTAHIHHPKMLPDLSPTVIQERSQRFSSQNTRVNENGSPMPFLITRSEDIAAEEQYSDGEEAKDALAEARFEEPVDFQDDDAVLLMPILPSRPLVSATFSQPKTSANKNFSNNSKQLPSSPHAPSAMGTMPLHHIYHDGEIVNAETKEPIIPMTPQDPFLGVTQNPQNSFMKALRKSTEAATKRVIPVANDQKASGDVAMRPAVSVGEDADEDPDKTLVESKLTKKRKQVHVSVSSSSSASRSSTRTSQPEESPNEESDEETEVKWRKALEPHQENMLECLLTISHVSNDI